MQKVYSMSGHGDPPKKPPLRQGTPPDNDPVPVPEPDGDSTDKA